MSDTVESLRVALEAANRDAAELAKALRPFCNRGGLKIPLDPAVLEGGLWALVRHEDRLTHSLTICHLDV
jgi:hypothetical protein